MRVGEGVFMCMCVGEGMCTCLTVQVHVICASVKECVRVSLYRFMSCVYVSASTSSCHVCISEGAWTCLPVRVHVMCASDAVSMRCISRLASS